METPKDIIDTIGREQVIARLGVDKRRVDRAALQSELPALWYAALEEMAGEPLDRSLFSFKGMDK